MTVNQDGFDQPSSCRTAPGSFRLWLPLRKEAPSNEAANFVPQYINVKQMHGSMKNYWRTTWKATTSRKGSQLNANLIYVYINHNPIVWYPKTLSKMLYVNNIKHNWKTLHGSKVNQENKQKDEGTQPASFFQVKIKFRVKETHFREDISNKQSTSNHFPRSDCCSLTYLKHVTQGHFADVTQCNSCCSLSRWQTCPACSQLWFSRPWSYPNVEHSVL